MKKVAAIIICLVLSILSLNAMADSHPCTIYGTYEVKYDDMMSYLHHYGIVDKEEARYFLKFYLADDESYGYIYSIINCIPEGRYNKECQELVFEVIALKVLVNSGCTAVEAEYDSALKQLKAKSNLPDGF